MKSTFRLLFSLAFLILCGSFATAQQAGNTAAIAESIVGQITSTFNDSFVRDISGDGRFVVFESRGNHATEAANRNNADGNIEVFLFDYAQRRIFQITNTTAALVNVSGSSTLNSNIRVDVASTRPVLSNNGRIIAFVSNATSNVAGNTTPAFFNGNLIESVGGANTRPTAMALEQDGNLEAWLYEIPVVAPVADLSSGAEAPFVNLAAGTMTRVTDSPASFAPVAGSDTQTPIIRDDNNLPQINDDGSVITFVSDRDLLANGSTPGTNADNNREIYVYLRGTANPIKQVTRTPRGSITRQIFNVNPSLSGNGRRVAFASTASNPLSSTGIPGNNTDNNFEVFYANLNADGTPVDFVQVTNTVAATADQITVLYSIGRRISRDGRYIAFETLTDNPAGGGTNQTNGFAVYVLDTAATTDVTRYIRYTPRTFEDPIAGGGDLRRFPVFSDTNAAGTPATLVFASRLSFTTGGVVTQTVSQSLNADPNRPTQIFSAPLVATTMTPLNITRLSRHPAPIALADTQPFAANSSRRIAYNLPNSELGGGNQDAGYEAFYLISDARRLGDTTETDLRFATGASARPVGSPQPVPSPSPSATPITPNAVAALSPGTLAIARLGYTRTTAPKVATGTSTARRFELPIELGGVSVNVEGAAAGIYRVDYNRREITFVVPPGVGSGTFTVTVKDGDQISRDTLTTVAAQPDLFNNIPFPTSGGRARLLNVTNRVAQAEPFNVTTVRIRPPGRTATVLRLFLTGVQGLPASAITIRVGNVTIPAANVLTGARATDLPGVYTVDFALPSTLNAAGDVPIVVTTTTGVSRVDDTAPRVRIL